MNASSKKPAVAHAQMYFVRIVNFVHGNVLSPDNIDRVVIREELTEGMKALTATAADHGVRDFSRFVNAGYQGMYNMTLDEIKKAKGVPKNQQIFDRMNRVELAANLFRVTQTEEKVRQEDIRGQAALENAAHQVGVAVRETMIRVSGIAPEQHKIVEPISEVKAQLKRSKKTFATIDETTKTHRMLETIVVVDEDSENDREAFTADPDDDE
jgi:DNA-damage-inducible protein D